MTTKKRTPKETWDAIVKGAEDDEIERALAESPEEVDQGLREAGLDPATVRSDGAALAKKLMADRERLAWQVEAALGEARDLARAKGREGRYAKLDRAELLTRLTASKKDPRLAQPVAFMFRNHAPEQATEAQLREMLEAVDALAERKKDDGKEDE
jgi:hypothetical protein